MVEFDFVSPPSEGVSSIEFRVPEEVIEHEDDYREGRYHDVITLSAVESDDPSTCAVKYDFSYVEGGLDRLLQDSETWYEDGSGAPEQARPYMLTEVTHKHVDLSEDYTSAVVPVDCAASPTDANKTALVIFRQFDLRPRFAYAKVSVMKGGELFIQESDIRRWQADSNGNWIRD
ncbi:hypothetical protein [Nocardiopsis sp. SBT366]|uniref:hypothetical protein n=1 Tax=Nocardiopsis sp. SBT366 TaxID=1580529 RepID=UPI0012E130A4|nr:hypothetical protein [Nocardiopsis sp. SBT366]